MTNMSRRWDQVVDEMVISFMHTAPIARPRKQSMSRGRGAAQSRRFAVARR
jgi:hypothetical protein